MIGESNNNGDVFDSVPPNAQELNEAATGSSSSNAAACSSNTGLGFSIASLVCGIISFMCCCTVAISVMCAIAGLVLGIYACYRNFAGKGLAIAGIVFSGVGLFFSLGFLMLYVISSFTSINTPTINGLGSGIYS